MATPSLLETIRAVIDWELVDLHTAMPGVVESYDPATGLANVSPCLKRTQADDTVVDLPVIPNVPVIMPRAAAGAAYIHLPLAKGDPVTLLFSERSLDAWKTSGGKVDPKDPRKHHLSDAYAIPGGYPRAAQPMKFATANDLVLVNGLSVFKMSPDGTIQVTGQLGELITALINLFSTATTAGGYPLLASPADYAILQGFKPP